MTILLIVGSIFIAKFFFSLKNQKKTLVFLNTFLGVFVFLFVYFLSTILITFLSSTLIDKFYFSNEILINCFSIPLSFLVSGIHYKVLENKLRIKTKEIVEIGNK